MSVRKSSTSDKTDKKSRASLAGQGKSRSKAGSGDKSKAKGQPSGANGRGRASAKAKATGAPKKAEGRKASAGSTASRKKSASASRSRGRTKSSTQRRVFFFGGGRADGDAGMREVLGGKGANLAEMTTLGIPVPPGFTVSTEVCAEFNLRGQRLPVEVRADVLTALANVEQLMDLRFGDPDRPLL
ncbi:MAG TPA: PEP/pyruvate-binding domain-containing protein, partial [Myxococcota bacterium]|nr:PEP/pyruvate-binding domain-containing protein [Myxococcota bacterium]